MDIKDAQDLIHRIYYERDKERGIDGALLRTFQELAELSDAIQTQKKEEEIDSEMADVFAWVISIANLLHIDLADALLRKYNHVCSRCGQVPCICHDSR